VNQQQQTTTTLLSNMKATSKPKAVYVAATKQHVGKTTTCLALMKGAQQILGNHPDGGSRVGFIKPVGQRHVVVDGGIKVDKDVVLFKEHFKLDRCKWSDLSPVVIPAGYTRDFLDGKVTEQGQIAAVENAFRNISSTHDLTIVEGTGHVGGSFFF
jgi:phosphate acetyltransferase